MNYWLLGAGVLSGITFAAHIFGGGPEILVPLQNGDMAAVPKAIWTVVWHGVSATILIGTVGLIFAAIKPGRMSGMVWCICAQYTAFTALFIVYGLTKLQSLWIMPQWIAFSLIVALALAGMRGSNPR